MNKLDKYFDKERVKESELLTMAITPSGSGEMHLGHHSVLYSLLENLAKNYSANKATIFIDDREFSFRAGPVIPDNGTVQKLTEGIKLFIKKFEINYSVKINSKISIEKMSDFFGREGISFNNMGYDLYNTIIKNRKNIKKIYRNSGLSEQTVNGICPSCKKGGISKKNEKVFDKNAIIGTCKDVRCIEKEYFVDIEDGDTNWAISYILLTIRNALISNKENVGISAFLGGDYLSKWGYGGTAKIIRMDTLMQNIFPNIDINYFGGPLIMTNGVKMSKSEGHKTNDIDFSLLEQITNSKEEIFHF